MKHGKEIQGHACTTGDACEKCKPKEGTCCPQKSWVKEYLEKNQTIKDAESYAFKSGELHGIAVERKRIREKIEKMFIGLTCDEDVAYNKALKNLLREI